MTRAKREQLIERYLREELTPSEEHDFFIEAATDKELRFDLKASRVLENAFRKDRKAAPSSYAPMRNHLAEILAGSRPEQASHEEKSQSTARKSGTASPLGWIVTAASIGLVALTSLLIGIVAIDKNGDDAGTSAPTVMEENAHRTPLRSPQTIGPLKTGAEEGTFMPAQENPIPDGTKRIEAGHSKSSNYALRRENGLPAADEGSEPKVEEQQNMEHPPQGFGKANPENISDTTEPDMNGPITVDTP